jgi:hypothetical protein
MYETHYHRASSVDDAAAQFAKGSEAKYLSGGQTLLPVMKQRLAAPSDVIDLARIPALIGIEVSGDAVTIKAATPHYDVATSAAVQKAIPALAALAGMIGDPAVRYRGTIGGSLANNDPAADYPAAVLALDATVKTNKRSIAAADFFKGLFSTALEDGEIITAVTFPIPAKAGLALRADRRVRGADEIRRSPRRRHRRLAERRDARLRHRTGAQSQLVARRRRRRHRLRRRHDGRSPWHRRLPRKPRQGHGPTRNSKRRVTFGFIDQRNMTARLAARRCYFRPAILLTRLIRCIDNISLRRDTPGTSGDLPPHLRGRRQTAKRNPTRARDGRRQEPPCVRPLKKPMSPRSMCAA